MTCMTCGRDVLVDQPVWLMVCVCGGRCFKWDDRVTTFRFE